MSKRSTGGGLFDKYLFIVDKYFPWVFFCDSFLFHHIFHFIPITFDFHTMKSQMAKCVLMCIHKKMSPIEENDRNWNSYSTDSFYGLSCTSLWYLVCGGQWYHLANKKTSSICCLHHLVCNLPRRWHILWLLFKGWCNTRTQATYWSLKA